jgi:valyl-tRNA synthetase
MWDILFFWVARMMMLGLYCTGQVPFKIIHLHARVVDQHGQKMSKSKGNVINPLEMTAKYGADALRLSLIYNVSPASDIAIYDAKIRSMRNFINKLWNIGRFILSRLNSLPEIPKFPKSPDSSFPEDRRLLTDLAALIQSVTKNLNRYRFDFALEALYHFIWHRFADQYLESSKSRQDESALTVLRHVYLTCLKLLHPFAPFITETLWQHFKGKTPLIISPWPKSN